MVALTACEQTGGKPHRGNFMPRKKQAAADAAPETAAQEPAPHFSHDDRLPMPGAIIAKTYKGRAISVKVLANGFECEGTTYRSLSAVAKAITGSHCNGYLFFRMGQHGEPA